MEVGYAKLVVPFHHYIPQTIHFLDLHTQVRTVFLENKTMRAYEHSCIKGLISIQQSSICMFQEP